MMMTWKTVQEDTGNGRGRMMHFRLSDKIEVKSWDGSTKYEGRDFVASATPVPVGGDVETYIFPADENGDVVDWGELPGSRKGEMDPEAAAERMVQLIDNGVLSRD